MNQSSRMISLEMVRIRDTLMTSRRFGAGDPDYCFEFLKQLSEKKIELYDFLHFLVSETSDLDLFKALYRLSRSLLADSFKSSLEAYLTLNEGHVKLAENLFNWTMMVQWKTPFEDWAEIAEKMKRFLLDLAVQKEWTKEFEDRSMTLGLELNRLYDRLAIKGTVPEAWWDMGY